MVRGGLVRAGGKPKVSSGCASKKELSKIHVSPHAHPLRGELHCAKLRDEGGTSQTGQYQGEFWRINCALQPVSVGQTSLAKVFEQGRLVIAGGLAGKMGAPVSAE